MASHRVKLNPALLIWARESAGYSVDAFAHALEQPPATIMEWEIGEERPTIRQLEKIANKVKRPLATFFLPTPPREPDHPRDFRTVPRGQLGHFDPATLLAFRKARNARQAIIDIAEPRPPLLPRASMRDDVEELAASVRTFLGITPEEQLTWRNSYQAIARWREVLERAGILTLQFSFPREDLRAFAMQDEPRLPVIVVTAKDSVEARIFSLSHELGHIVLGSPDASCKPSFMGGTPRRQPHATVERYCNNFSAALLLPDITPINDVLLEATRDASIEKGVRRAANKCRVSRFVVLGRMFTRGLIPEARFWQLLNEWNQHSEAFQGTAGGDFFRNKFAEKGKTYTSTIIQAFDSGHINELEAAEYLECRVDHLDVFRSMLGTEAPPEE